MNPDNLEELQGQYEDIDAKALLIQQNAILEDIRRQLHILTDSAHEPSEESEEQYKCTVCNSTVPQSDVEEHGESCFGWTNSIGRDALMTRYEHVD